MRGCASTLSRHGYHNRTIAFFAEFDLCREVLASELFRLTSESSSEEIYYGGGGFMAMGGPMNPMDGQPVQVCSCLGDKCNKQMSSGSAVVVRRHFFFVGMAPVLYALLLICFHNYFSFSPNFRIIFK
ncbi:hypothetical protein niasHT_001246 [Heterodera trifolii]|uniref:Uncharacterized protein n=1 Tax=Heterodera trifolii TaxID=157864 RepID=A0ABD2M6A2_9BILA